MVLLKTRFYTQLSIGVATLLFFTATLNSCYYDIEDELYPTSACDTTLVLYSDDVLPIIQNQCYGCHDMSTSFGGITLEPYSSLKVYADNGLLECVITHGSTCSPMPKNNSKMLDCDINRIIKWMNEGALNN